MDLHYLAEVASVFVPGVTCVMGVIAGCVFGVLAGWLVADLYAWARLRRIVRESCGVADVFQDDSFASSGAAQAILQLLVWRSTRPAEDAFTKGRLRKVLSWGAAEFGELLWKAGLAETCSVEACISVRGYLCCGCTGFGLLVGAVFSWQLALLLAVLGVVMGYRGVGWALRQEALERCRLVEGELSQMLDVMVLGLRSGLSFQRSLGLYCQHFDTTLGASFVSAMKRWEWGLSDRDAALKSLAASYDSPLLTRGVDSMVRSIRFGTSISDVLEDVSADSRELHKARVQEQVAKAPVKMMLPIGTLVLPAMLLIVLGPVLLELMEGF